MKKPIRTDEEIVTIMRRVVIRELRSWRWHPDYEDMVQEGVLKAWRQWPPRNPTLSPVTVARVCAHHAAGTWAHSRKAFNKPSHLVQWEYLADQERDEAGEEPQPLTDGFEERLLNRLEAAETARAALAAMSVRQRELVQKTIMAGREYKAVAIEEGQSPPSLWYCVQRGLARARTKLVQAGLHT